MQVLHPTVPAHLVQRLEARPAEAHLAEGLAQQVGKSVLVFVGDACERGIETEARIDADDQQVKRVWQTLLNLGSPSVDLLLEPQDRRVVAEDQADDGRDAKVDDVAQEQPDEQAERREDRGRDEADRHEVFWSQVARPTRHLQPVEHVLASFLRRRAGQQRAKLFDRRPEHPLAERALQLDLLHGHRLLSAVDGQTLLDHLGRVRIWRARDADEEHQDAARADQCKKKGG